MTAGLFVMFAMPPLLFAVFLSAFYLLLSLKYGAEVDSQFTWYFTGYRVLGLLLLGSGLVILYKEGAYPIEHRLMVISWVAGLVLLSDVTKAVRLKSSN